MKLTIDDDKGVALLRTRTTPSVLAFASALEGRRTWKPEGLQFEATGRNIEIAESLIPGLSVDRIGQTPTEPHQGVAEEFFEGKGPYRMKTEPYDHQRRAGEKALPKLLSDGSFALFMEQGTGKTKTAIDLAGEMHHDDLITGVLVIARKGVHRQWVESEIPTHLGTEWTGAYWPTRNKEIPEELLQPGDLKVFTINWDGAKTPHGKRACLEFVMAHKGKVLIIGDETQDIKNARSARWKAAAEIAKAAGKPFYRLALTGTPVAKDLTDEWSQLKWLNEDILGIRYVSSFRNEYCVMGGFEGRVVIGQKNLDRFRQKVDPFTFRATKDEIGILPKSYRTWKFDLTNEQRRMIKELRRTLETQIDSGEIVSTAHAAVALLKVQQISNGFVTDDDGNLTVLHPPANGGWKKNPRLLALSEVLEAYDGQVIIWARFRQDMEMIGSMLEQQGQTFVGYHGGTPDKARAEGVGMFLGGGARVFLSNPQAGGTGLNLQKGGCAHSIYYSNSYNAIDRWQSEDRIHRIGTKGAVVYTDLVANGGLDGAILSNLKRKKGIADLALGDIRKILEEL